ncbi:MAG: hypothetical protein AAF641_15920 [Pseudomonadota bacterium]
MTRLVILAGAHKTASSHIQHSLLGSAPALSDLGIAVIGPKTMRKDLTPFSQLLRDGMTAEVVRAGADGFLKHFGRNSDTIALMDENILGGTDRKMLMRRKKLYPWAHTRVARLLQLFEGHDIELAIATRNPATFLPSCWSESLHHGRYDNFESFTAGFDPTDKNWTRLVDRILTTCPSLKLTLWRYEDFGALGTRLYAHLLKQGADQAINPDPQIRRAGLSQRAADWFQAQDTRDKATVQEARARFPKTGPETAFNPWSDDERATLERSYKRDIARLADRDGVTLLQP